MTTTPLRASLLCLLLAGAGGCASGKKSQPVQQSSAQTQRATVSALKSVAQSEGNFSNPVERSALRERALTLLADATRGADPQLRANAIEGMQAAPTRLEPFVRLGLTDPNLGVRYTAAVTAGKAKLISLAPEIRPLLSDPSQVVRAAAVFALTTLGEQPDPSVLANLLAGNDLRARAQAAYLLGELRNPSAVAMLRESARRVPTKAPLVEVQFLRLQIAEALVKLGDQSSIEILRAALYPARPEDLESTALAVQIIGQVQDRRSVDQLIYLTAQDGADRMPAEVRLAAAASLAQLGQPQGSFIADEQLSNPMPALRAQCAYVLGETAQAGALAKLDALQKDNAGLVRVAAAAATLKAIEKPSAWSPLRPAQASATDASAR